MHQLVYRGDGHEGRVVGIEGGVVKVEICGEVVHIPLAEFDFAKKIEPAAPPPVSSSGITGSDIVLGGLDDLFPGKLSKPMPPSAPPPTSGSDIIIAGMGTR